MKSWLFSLLVAFAFGIGLAYGFVTYQPEEKPQVPSVTQGMDDEINALRAIAGLTLKPYDVLTRQESMSFIDVLGSIRKAKVEQIPATRFVQDRKPTEEIILSRKAAIEQRPEVDAMNLSGVVVDKRGKRRALFVIDLSRFPDLDLPSRTSGNTRNVSSIPEAAATVPAAPESSSVVTSPASSDANASGAIASSDVRSASGMGETEVSLEPEAVSTTSDASNPKERVPVLAGVGEMLLGYRVVSISRQNRVVLVGKGLTIEFEAFADEARELQARNQFLRAGNPQPSPTPTPVPVSDDIVNAAMAEMESVTFAADDVSLETMYRQIRQVIEAEVGRLIKSITSP